MNKQYIVQCASGAVTHLKLLFVASIMMLGFATMLNVATAPTALANNGCRTDFFGLPAWYDGLTDGQCNIASPNSIYGSSNNPVGMFVWRIVLNITDALIRVVGYATVIMIIVGGFRYMTATGDSGKVTGAKNTIRNAVVGLVIALASVAIVNVVKDTIF